jgi:hypothetical protein
MTPAVQIRPAVSNNIDFSAISPVATALTSVKYVALSPELQPMNDLFGFDLSTEHF